MTVVQEKALWLIKRDFRLFDNTALFTATHQSTEVLPVYCFEDLVYQGPDWGRFHSYASKSALTALRKNLRHHQSDVYVCRGDLLQELMALKKVYPFTAIYAHEETGLNHTYNRDKALHRWCTANNVVLHEYCTNGVIRRLDSRDNWEAQFTRYMEQPVWPIPSNLQITAATKKLAAGTKMQTDKALKIVSFSTRLPVVSEHNAHQTLRDFLHVSGHTYRGGIGSMNTAPERCSRLSYDLAWGTVSLRTVLRQTERQRYQMQEQGGSSAWVKSLTAFKSRLYWHAHFIQKLESEVAMEHHPQNRIYAGALPYVEGEELSIRLQAWKTGNTGYPSIDAAMRYYQANGWLNFRSRAMIVSFACHALRIPWQVIVYELAPFMMDYVPGIHVAQVQMQAGVTGTNVIRVYSPMKQMEDKDPDAIFIKSQIPELREFSAEAIANFQDVPLGTYAAPIIDFKLETKIMKDALYSLKKTPDGRAAARKVYLKHGSRSRVKRS
jgi:deoxyribodipyrimidine photo-lyase